MDLRERTRRAVRDEVAAHAWKLFAEHGFEATTVEQIAAAAGMSRRSFFRYFAGKEELVLDRLVESGHEIAAVMRARPPDEPAWAAVRAAFAPVVAAQEARPEYARPLLVMLREPRLSGTIVERQRRWKAVLAPLIAERLTDWRGLPGADPRPDAIAGAALACFEAAQDAWLNDADALLAPLLDAAMGAIAPL